MTSEQIIKIVHDKDLIDILRRWISYDSEDEYYSGICPLKPTYQCGDFCHITFPKSRKTGICPCHTYGLFMTGGTYIVRRKIDHLLYYAKHNPVSDLEVQGLGVAKSKESC